MHRSFGWSAPLVLVATLAAGCEEKPFCETHAEGTACDDGDPCTFGEMCADGACVPGSPMDCSALDDACHAGACDRTDGTCRAFPLADGTVCDDGDPCTGDGTCALGLCGGAAPVDCSALDDACHAGACDPASGACRAEPLADGTACDDGVACTGGDACRAGVCTGAPEDADADGHAAAGCLDGDDCDDGRAEVHPGATEGPAGDATCADLLDNDCDGATDDDDAGCLPVSEICPRTEMPDGIAELRLRSLTIASPVALTNAVLQQLIADSLERNLFVWLLRLEGLGSGDAMLETGAGQLVPGASCTYRTLEPDYPPATAALVQTGMDFEFAGPPIARLDVPMWTEGTAYPDPPMLVLPLRELEVSGTLSADRLQIGSWNPVSEEWTDGGSLEAKITAADADATVIEALGMTLCGLLSGATGAPGDPADDCEGDPAAWPRPPDTTVGAAPAYAMTATFAASAVYRAL
ncbi:MAG: hypothetical protein JXB32_00350 [Deltaproteobacteria bacterium]|nr:hypothetical protein [Deltaproteobacteria bacterium]